MKHYSRCLLRKSLKYNWLFTGREGVGLNTAGSRKDIKISDKYEYMMRSRKLTLCGRTVGVSTLE